MACRLMAQHNHALHPTILSLAEAGAILTVLPIYYFSHARIGLHLSTLLVLIP